MKTGCRVAGITILLCAVAAAISGQTLVVNSPPLQTIFEFAEQPDSPLRFAVPERLVGTPIEISTNSDRAITGYVLHLDYDGQQKLSINMRPERQLVRGRPILQGFGIPTNGQNAVKRVLVSVDYVRFSDGGSWGSDNLGGSRIISTHLEGRDIAIKRLLTMLADENLESADFLAPIRVFGGFSLGGPVNMKLDEAHFRLEGYRTVIKSLRSMGKRSAEGQDLARKLELRENSLDQ